MGIILGIYAAGWLAACDLGWGLRARWNGYATAAVLGLAYAALVERAALAAGRWSYTERMPVVSVLGAGVGPLLQMTLLPPTTLLAPFNAPQLEGVAQEVEAMIVKIMKEAASS